MTTNACQDRNYFIFYLCDCNKVIKTKLNFLPFRGLWKPTHVLICMVACKAPCHILSTGRTFWRTLILFCSPAVTSWQRCVYVDERMFVMSCSPECFLYLCQVIISSIMCSYNKEDWKQLAKMAEVGIASKNAVSWFPWCPWSNNKCGENVWKINMGVLRNRGLMLWSWTCHVLMGWEREAWAWPVDR